MSSLVLNTASGTVSTLLSNFIDLVSGTTLNIGSGAATLTINIGGASTLQSVNIGTSGTGQTLISLGGATDSVARFSNNVIQMGGSAMTATAADWLQGAIYVNSGGVATLTTPTGTQLQAALNTIPTVGQVWQTLLVHNGSVINVAAGAGVTFGSSSLGTTASGVTRIIYTRYTGANTFTMY